MNSHWAVFICLHTMGDSWVIHGWLLGDSWVIIGRDTGEKHILSVSNGFAHCLCRWTTPFAMRGGRWSWLKVGSMLCCYTLMAWSLSEWTNVRMNECPNVRLYMSISYITNWICGCYVKRTNGQTDIAFFLRRIRRINYKWDEECEKNIWTKRSKIRTNPQKKIIFE